jgi:hypothetical protein
MVAIPSEAPNGLAEKWVLGLKTYAEIINQNRGLRIPDETKFLERLAAPASAGYQGLINPAFISNSDKVAGDITTDQGANLRRAYKKYAGKLDRAFETVDGVPAKRFKEAVERAKGDFSEGFAQRGLPFTGSYLYGLGLAGIAPRWLVGDQKVVGDLRHGDRVLEGGPYQICQTLSRAGFKASLAQRLVQAGAQILKANHDGTVITAQNDRINHLTQSQIDPALGLTPFATGGLSHVDFVLDGAKALLLEIQVDQI